jgi:tripartite ATP-independent transporter DctP family solute receptor
MRISLEIFRNFRRKETMRVLKIISIVFVLVFVSTGILIAGAEPIELTLGHAGAGVGCPISAAAIAWANEVDRLSDGSITVNVFPDHQLGGERDLMEGIQAGTIDLYIGSTGMASNFTPEYKIFNLPFLFVSPEHAAAVLTGPIGEKLSSFADNYGFKGMGIGGTGFRMPMNSKRPIKTPDDFKGLKFRCMEIPMHLATYKAFGASPVPIASPELYTALQLGTVDGNEQTPSIGLSKGFAEIQDYWTVLPVLLNGDVFVMNPAKFDSLSKEQQEIMIKAAKVAVETFNDVFIEEDQKAFSGLREAGMDIYQPTKEELQLFIDATQVVWDEYLPEFPKEIQDIALEIKEMAKKY